MVSVGTAMTAPVARDSAARLEAAEVTRLPSFRILVVEAMPRRVLLQARGEYLLSSGLARLFI